MVVRFLAPRVRQAVDGDECEEAVEVNKGRGALSLGARVVNMNDERKKRMILHIYSRICGFHGHCCTFPPDQLLTLLLNETHSNVYENEQKFSSPVLVRYLSVSNTHLPPLQPLPNASLLRRLTCHITTKYLPTQTELG